MEWFRKHDLVNSGEHCATKQAIVPVMAYGGTCAVCVLHLNVGQITEAKEVLLILQGRRPFYHSSGFCGGRQWLLGAVIFTLDRYHRRCTF